MKIKSVINELSLKCYSACCDILPLVLIGGVASMVIPTDALADVATNHLAGLKSEVGATFGAGSDMQYFLLLAEGLAGTWAYIKSKNIMVLGGVPLLMAFTHWALK